LPYVKSLIDIDFMLVFASRIDAKLPTHAQ